MNSKIFYLNELNKILIKTQKINELNLNKNKTQLLKTYLCKKSKKINIDKNNNIYFRDNILFCNHKDNKISLEDKTELVCETVNDNKIIFKAKLILFDNNLHVIKEKSTRQKIINRTNIDPKIVGDIGEDLTNIVDCEFTDIQNLNKLENNFPIFDIVAKKGDVVYAFSIKARNKYSNNGKFNDRYNLLTRKTPEKNAELFRKSINLLKKHNYDTDNIIYCFLITMIEKEKDCIYYWGKFTDIKPEHTVENILSSKCKSIGVKTNDEYLKTYNIFGVCQWNF